jgi:Ala-tRNA(Pro) deacylase
MDIAKAVTTTRVDAITYFLDRTGIEYELVVHRPAVSAYAEALASHESPDRVAKTVILRDDATPVIAVVPASRRLDMHKLRELLGATHRLQLATEDQIARDFPLLQIGAIPPFGPIEPTTEVIDWRLLEAARILCPAGDHRYSVLVDPHDLVRIAAAQVADISQD